MNSKQCNKPISANNLGLIAIMGISIVACFVGFSYALEGEWRGKTFEEGSDCAALFVTYMTTDKYDYKTKVPALLKFDGVPGSNYPEPCDGKAP